MTAFWVALTILAARIRWPRSDDHQRRANDRARRSAARRLERVMK